MGGSPGSEGGRISKEREKVNVENNAEDSVCEETERESADA